MKNDDNHNSGTKVLILVLMVSVLIGCVAGLLIYTLFIPPMIGSEKGQTTSQESEDNSGKQGSAESKTSQAATTTAAAPATTTAIAEETESAVETTSMDINELFDKAEENEDMQADYAQEEEEVIEETDDGDYILPYSSERELTEDDLAGLSARDLQLARNEIYARHGRGFNTDWIQEYFNGKSWYERNYSAEEFDRIEESTLSSLEKRNVEFIKDHE